MSPRQCLKRILGTFHVFSTLCMNFRFGISERGDATNGTGEGAINDGHQRQTCTCGDSTEPTDSEKADVKIRCIAKKSFVLDDCWCAIDLTGEDGRCVVGKMRVGLVAVTFGCHGWQIRRFGERIASCSYAANASCKQWFVCLLLPVVAWLLCRSDRACMSPPMGRRWEAG